MKGELFLHGDTHADGQFADAGEHVNFVEDLAVVHEEDLGDQLGVNLRSGPTSRGTREN